jgi:hypothetical protein
LRDAEFCCVFAGTWRSGLWKAGVQGRVNSDAKDSCGKRKAHEMLPQPLGHGLVSEMRCQSLVVRARVEQARQFLMGLMAANSSTLVGKEYMEAHMYACQKAEGMRRVNGYVSVAELPRGGAAAVSGGADFPEPSKHWWSPLVLWELLAQELEKCVEAGAQGTVEMARLIESLTDIRVRPGRVQEA